MDKLGVTSERPLPEVLRLIFGFALAALVLALLRAVFVHFSPAIIAAKPVVPPDQVTAWVRWAVYEHDGIETYVALPGMLFFLALVAVLQWRTERLRRTPLQLMVVGAGAIAAGFIVFRTRSSEFFWPRTGSATWLLVGAMTLLIWLWFEAQRRARFRVRQLSAVVGAALALILMLASTPDASLRDYSFYLGPALKHLRGEPLGSFYMQYNLGGTLLFEAMMALGWRLHQMTLVMSLSLCAWFLFYWLLVRRLFSTPFMGWLCLGALFVVRFLNIHDHPAYLPQTLPQRLDLWVLGMLAVDRWGVRCWKTACVFAALYALDSTFGFLSAAAYGLALGLTMLAERDRRFPWRELLPLVLVGVWTRIIFGSFFSPAASQYLGIQLGFLPISPVSLFWPIALMLGCATVVFVHQRKQRSSCLGLLICLLAVMHLIYFFGRSHDHNLLNISGVWVLAVFLAIDQAGPWLGARVAVATCFILVFVIMGAQQAEQKWKIASAAWSRGSWLKEHPVEKAIEEYRPIINKNVFLIELGDAYYNYRLDLPQRGYLSPFEANVLQDDTARLLDEALSKGQQLLSRNPSLPLLIQDLNHNRVGLKFTVLKDGQTFEVKRL